MDESAADRRWLFQWLQPFLELLHARFDSRTATANARLWRILHSLHHLVRVHNAIVVIAFLSLHWDHHIATVLQLYVTDIAKA